MLLQVSDGQTLKDLKRLYLLEDQKMMHFELNLGSLHEWAKALHFKVYKKVFYTDYSSENGWKSYISSLSVMLIVSL